MKVSGFKDVEVKECGVCGRYFHNPSFFYRCWICLKKDRDWELTKGDETLDVHITQFDLVYRDYQVLKDKPPQKIVKRYIRLDALAKKRMKQLLRLCHPDRHAGKMQKHATDITSWLLSIAAYSKNKK